MGKLYISMYHYTRDIKHSRYPQIKGLDKELFKTQIEYFKNKFNIVTMEQVIEVYRRANHTDYQTMRCCLLLMMDI